MDSNAKIARELMRIARMISASGATIGNCDECVNYLGEACDVQECFVHTRQEA